MRRLFVVLVVSLTAIASLAQEPDRQRIRLRILGEKGPRTAVTVEVRYPHPERSAATLVTLVTDRQGFVETEIPSNVFWVSVPEENAEVRGKEFRFATRSASVKRWDLRPREWKNEPKENEP